MANGPAITVTVMSKYKSTDLMLRFVAIQETAMRLAITAIGQMTIAQITKVSINGSPSAVSSLRRLNHGDLGAFP
jgi:hypothetical protein